jgi:hypothetical protein
MLSMGQPSELAPIVSETPLKKLDLLFYGLPARDSKRAVVVDVSICHHNNEGYNNSTPFASANARHKIKEAYYSNECENMDFDFRTFILDVTGARHQGTNDLISMATANSHSAQGSIADYTKLVNSIAVALTKSIGEKFETASNKFRSHHNRRRIA